MRRLISIILLFCVLLSVSGCANTQGSNAEISVSAAVGSSDVVESENVPSDSDEPANKKSSPK